MSLAAQPRHRRRRTTLVDMEVLSSSFLVLSGSFFFSRYVGDLRIIILRRKSLQHKQCATSALDGQQLDRPSKKFCGLILHKWVNQKTLDVAFYESPWKSSRIRPLNAGNNASRPSTLLDDKVLERRASSILLGVGETGAIGGAIPSRLFRRTSPRLEAGMCANGWASIRLLLDRKGGGLLTGVFCQGGETIKSGSCWMAWC